MQYRQTKRNPRAIKAKAGRRTRPPAANSRRSSSEAKNRSVSKRRAGRAASGSKQPALSKIELCIRKVKCDKTTRELINKDDIVLSAVLVDGNGQAHKGKTVQVGKFRKGDVESYARGKMVAQWALSGQDQSWPRCYEATLLMVERDAKAKSIGQVLDATVKAVEKQAKIELKDVANSAAMAAGAAIGSAIPIPGVGTVAGAALGKAVDFATKEIKRAREHDCFPPRVARLKLTGQPSKKGELPGSRNTLKFVGFGGKYTVEYFFKTS